MAYEEERMYYKATNQTRVRIYQDEPLREFEVMIDGDLRSWARFQVIEKAKEIMSRELNPNRAIEDLNNKSDKLEENQDKIMMVLTSLFEKIGDIK